MAAGDVIAVQTRLVKELLVEALHAQATAHADEQPCPADVREALTASAGGSDDGPPPSAVRAAALGYWTRVAETERFPAARSPATWLAERVAVSGSAAVSAELAASEPVGLPAPSDSAAATWRIPGPGGHVRHYTAERATSGLPGDAAALRIAWLTGFFARCCDECRP